MSASALAALGVLLTATGAADAKTDSFGLTGTVKQWTVPEEVTEATVTLYGAQGGGGLSYLAVGDNTGGEGGVTTAKLAVSPGQTLELRVGGTGETACVALPSVSTFFQDERCHAQGGFNGGGSAVGRTTGQYRIDPPFSLLSTNPSGGAGGGASDVRVCDPPGPCGLADRILVAGGGGGAASDNSTQPEANSPSKVTTAGCAPGGAGGGLEGADGCGPSPGDGGTQTAGGTGASAGQGGGSGGALLGAGGGGLYGGGTGGVASDESAGTLRAGGGGGGSGFCGSSPLVTSCQTAQGGRTGDGLITITYGTDSDDDGVEDDVDAFPNDPTETKDTDNDGVGDNADAYPNDPTETKDTDNDGVGDNGDPDTVADAVRALESTAFRAPGLRTATLARLAEAEEALAGGDAVAASRTLRDLRTHFDGCGSSADRDDWIVVCGAQTDIRELLDTLAGRLA